MKRLIAAGVVLVIAAIAAVVGTVAVQRHNDYQMVTLTSTNAAQVELFAVADDGDAISAGQTPTLTITTAGSYKLKKGSYVYLATAGSDYAPLKDQLSVENNPVSFSVQLTYSAPKLAQLLAVEQPLALQALQHQYPTEMAGFTPTDGKVYEESGAEWYAVLLAPNSSAQDTYRAVLKKGPSGWVVVTTPPAITLSQPVYPSIPPDVLDDVNNFQ